MWFEEKCEFCGGSHFILSTEREHGNWICKKICKTCEKILHENILRR